jgi:hypothetical protein
MTKTLFVSLATAGLLFAQPGAAQQQVPVAFAKGKSAATMTGSIKGDQDRTYTVDARAGQTMTVTLKATKGSAEMNVFSPGNDSAISLGALDPYKVVTVLPTTGRYRVQVYQMRASARRGETASYNLTIAITGGGVKPSTDALVPGTSYNAIATIRCVAEPDKPMTGCKAGVKRSGPGNAVVTISTPDGGSRSLTFRGGNVVGTNGGGSLRVDRRGDTLIVRVGASELYEIPDAFVNGG